MVFMSLESKKTKLEELLLLCLEYFSVFLLILCCLCLIDNYSCYYTIKARYVNIYLHISGFYILVMLCHFYYTDLFLNICPHFPKMGKVGKEDGSLFPFFYFSFFSNHFPSCEKSLSWKPVVLLQLLFSIAEVSFLFDKFQHTQLML